MRTVLIFTVLSLSLSSCGRTTVTDADGNVYPTVKIGNQVWTAENFRATRMTDGTPIRQVPDSVAWRALAAPGFCHYMNTTNTDTIRRFGAFYNWHCVGSKVFAPPGWHVSTDGDWDRLREHLIRQGHNWDGSRRDNRIAKSLSAQSGWKPFGIEGMPGNDMMKNNRSGFAGVAAGCRHDMWEVAGVQSEYQVCGHRAAWWSATVVNESYANVYGLAFCSDDLIKYEQLSKTCGYPIRLVKDRK